MRIVNLIEGRRSSPEADRVSTRSQQAHLGDHDQAISWLQKAPEERDGLMAHLNTLLYFDPLRTDPRFHALPRRMNFPENSQAMSVSGA